MPESSKIGNITIDGGLFGRVSNLIRSQVIPYMWEILNDRNMAAPDHSIENFTMAENKDKIEYPSHCIANFKIAAGLEKGDFYGMVFQDSDLYKWLEAVSYQLMSQHDSSLENIADETIDIIGKAQQADGYLDTYFILVEPENKFSNLCECHEMYVTGHMVEAAVAYYLATGKDKFLNIARRMVDLIEAKFGASDEKKKGYPGHEEIELSLIKLYMVTDDRKYLNLAEYFINERGKKPLYFDEEIKKRNYQSHFGYLNPPYGMYSYGPKYEQYHKPIREQETFEGHSVRCMYMACALADIARIADDQELKETCFRLYTNLVERRMYLTGGIGSTHVGEGFTCDYDLPNETIYAETCASVGLVFFMHRMLLLEQNSKYADTLERALYNTCIAGMSLDGKNFFYVNPLEVDPEISRNNPDRKHVLSVRPEWFGCACCPPNIARLISSLGEYLYVINNEDIYINLYIANKAILDVAGHMIELSVKTDYPYDDKIVVEIETAGKFNIKMRIPEWTSDKWSTEINGNNQEPDLVNGYACFTREWKIGDQLILNFDMTPKRIYANPRVAHDVGKVAIQKGPLIYCLEEVDNGKGLQRIMLPVNAEFSVEHHAEELGGIDEIHTKGFQIPDSDSIPLYSSRRVSELDEIPLTFIPYYSWANRGENEMTVWVHEM